MASASPPTSSSPGSPAAVESSLRHMQSNSLISPGSTSRRASTHYPLGAGYHPGAGSRSPTSIPSSPTSVHSSSSAIFERDIEPLSSPISPQQHHHKEKDRDPHRIPRAKTTEQIELSVPSVLDSAAEILTSLSSPPVLPTAASPLTSTSPLLRSPHHADAAELVAVETPAPYATTFGAAAGGGGRRSRPTSGFASPIGSLTSRSRSPSPGASPGRAGSGSGSLLLSIPPTTTRTAIPVARSASAGTPPSIITPTSAYFSTASSVHEVGDSPTTTTINEEANANSSSQPASPQSVIASVPTSPPPPPPVSPTAAHPAPASAAQKRLSFLSYSDLLLSTPSSTLPLSMLTSPGINDPPPPHLTSLIAPTGPASPYHPTGGGERSATASIRSFPLDLGPGQGGKRESIVLLDEVGGEWEREGLGKGLEERLEELMAGGQQQQVVNAA